MTDLSNEAKLDAWKDAVKKKYPALANKIKFKLKPDTKEISAEITGQDRCYGVYSTVDGKGEVLESESFNILQNYLDESESHISFDVLEEALKMAKVTVYLVTPKDIPELKKDVFGIKNESPVVEFLVTLLGIPRDGTVYKIRTGYMSYQDEHKILLFASNKYDLPKYLGNRPAKSGMK